MSHLCDRYFRKHGHYPRVAVISGVSKVYVEFSPTYVSIRTSSPYQAQVYITRSAFISLLRKVMPVAKKWAQDPAGDHDVPKAMHQAYLHEAELLRERREMKRGRTFDVEAEASRKRQHQRWLAAKARGERRQT